MNCSLRNLTGLAAECEANIGGIRRAWVGIHGNFTYAADTTTGSTAHMITGITGTTDAKFYQYDFNRQTGSLNSELTKDEVNGITYYTNTATFVFSRMESKKHLEIQALAKGQLDIIVEDCNGKFWLIGYDNYAGAESNSATTGTSYTDRNGYEIAISQMSAWMPFGIEKATFESLIQEPAI